MGVHLTFVRSVDLDEWTQRQIDAMRIGGNDNAKKFFTKHGCTDFHTKTEKKYTSKAAVAYRAELSKLVEAEAAKRGEGSIDASSSSAGAGNLFDNADAVMKKSLEDEARARVDAARSNGGAASSSAGVLQPSAKLASQMTGAKGKLVTPTGTPQPTPPPSGGVKGGVLKPPSNGPKLVLRKPGTTTASSRLLKKTSTASTASRLRVNKITTPDSTSSISDDALFEDVETTQKNIEESKKKEEEDRKRQQEEDEALAKRLQDELNGLGGTASTTQASAMSSSSSLANEMAVPPTPTSTPASGVLAAEPPKPKMSALEENMAKLSAMNNDFFSGL